MSRALSSLAVFGITLAWLHAPALYAQGQISGILSQFAPTPTVSYYEGQAPATTTELPAAVHYDAGPGCAPLLPTIVDGIRNTLNCLLPCRGSGRLGLGGPLLGNRRGAGLFSVRFYEGCGCGVPIPRCGCGIQVIDEGIGIPTPAGYIPEVNPPKPVPDSSVYYYQRLPQRTVVPAVYHPGQLRGIVQPGGSYVIKGAPISNLAIPARYDRASSIPNPLRP
jgi:hypothetical protein